MLDKEKLDELFTYINRNLQECGLTVDDLVDDETAAMENEIPSSLERFEWALDVINSKVGSTKMVFWLEDYPGVVIKIPYRDSFGFGVFSQANQWPGAEENDEPWDYCRAEARIYDLASKQRLDKYFAATYYLGTTDGGIPIYYAEEVEDCYEDEDVEGSPGFNSLDTKDCFVTTAIEEIFYNYYGEDGLIRLLSFLEAYDIKDIYEANIGKRFNDNSVVILDYSSLRD